MSSTIAAASPASQIQTVAPPQKSGSSVKDTATKAPAQPTAASPGSTAQQQAALNRMLATYARDQSRGTDARTLSNLGKQIMSAAKAMGQHVTLPHAPASSSEASTTPAASATPTEGKVNVTA